MDEEKEYILSGTVSMLKCLRCGHEWLPRKVGVVPKTCSKCHSAYCFTPRTRPKKEKVENK